MADRRGARDPRLWTGEREVYRHAIPARHAFGGGACTLLVIGTNKRVLLPYEAATVRRGTDLG